MRTLVTSSIVEWVDQRSKGLALKLPGGSEFLVNKILLTKKGCFQEGQPEGQCTAMPALFYNFQRSR
jgi:hypothetical protein